MTDIAAGLVAACMLVGLAGCGAAMGGPPDALPKMPIPVDRSRTADERWRAKPAIESRLLSDMETPEGWSHRGAGRMEFTTARAKDGSRALRLTSPTKGDKPGGNNGRPWGEACARFDARSQDWTAWNRLSVWVWPRLPGFKTISLLVKFSSDGVEKLPGSQTRGALHYVILRPDTWNHVVWEIPQLARDKVTAVEFIYRLQGNEPGAAETVCYDFDRLELQKVEVDHWEGWNVAPGRIACCHAGYTVRGPKTAVASGLAATEFSLLGADGKAVVTRPIRTATTPLGEFQVMDFSGDWPPGDYRLRAGDVTTPLFPIAPDVWRDTILRTINHFYCQRCGFAVPGVHDVCHADWQGRRGEQTIAINGGWHDAGDLSQGVINTGEAAYAMFDLADRLRRSDPALAQRLIEEGRWGLDWILKTRFGDGFRTTWATMDFWTDGRRGTSDDVVAEAKDSPMENFIAAMAEARAARSLAKTDPKTADACLAAARDDWQHAVAKTGERPHLELAAYAALASVEVFKATADKACAEAAARYARVIVECQQREATDWRVPMVGFFYTGPDRRGIQHYFHRGHENAPIEALVGLCEALPDHPDWATWYATVVLHSEYLRAIARFTEPYGMFPASVYREGEGDAYAQAQVKQGIDLGSGHYLRRFPVWWDFRGNSGTMLSQAKALSAACRLRGDGSAEALIRRQLEWHLGYNPFGQSLMYGAGYDYAPQYTAMSGDIVGGLPVGIQTLREGDMPYWPTSNCYNYKEIWVHPSSRWLAVLADLAAPGPPPGAGDAGETTLRAAPESDGSARLRITLSTRRGRAIRFALMRTWNLKVAEARCEARRLADGGEAFEWRAEVVNPKAPWVAVILPGGDLAQRLELCDGFPPLPAAP